jgi:hypothetical protein
MVHFLATFYALVLEINHICEVSSMSQDFFKNISFHFQTELVVNMLQYLGKLIRGTAEREQLSSGPGQANGRTDSRTLFGAEPLPNPHWHI